MKRTSRLLAGGFTPTIARSIARPPRSCSLVSEDGQRYFELSRTLFEPHPATASGQAARQKRATLISPGGQPREERPAGHLTRACGDPSGSKPGDSVCTACAGTHSGAARRRVLLTAHSGDIPVDVRDLICLYLLHLLVLCRSETRSRR